jgi:hypothetical protein
MTDVPPETAVSMPGGCTFGEVSSLTSLGAPAWPAPSLGPVEAASMADDCITRRDRHAQSAGYAGMLEHVTVLAR